MSTRTLIGTSLVVLLAGCSAAESPSGEAGGALGLLRCPDPTTDCSSPNGTGVYTDEDGHAGIDSVGLMITHFVNHGSSVSFQGKYYDAASSWWLPVDGNVSSANYLSQKNVMVTEVWENATIPIWRIFDNNANPPAYTNVTGPQIQDLKVIISVAIPGASKLYELSWDSFDLDTSAKLPVRVANMKWRVANTNNAPQQYCFDANNGPDRVVFQQGLGVNPVNASVTRANAAGVVTMSCRLGAIATVHSWGYPYRDTSPTDTFYFDSGLQMKRASYCADGNHFTEKGTLIQVKDNLGIRDDSPINYPEAYWTPQGATCLEQMRHSSSHFYRQCPNRTIPYDCAGTFDPTKFIEDGGLILQP